MILAEIVVAPSAWIAPTVCAAMLFIWCVGKQRFGGFKLFKLTRIVATLIFLVLAAYSMAIWGSFAAWWLLMVLFWKGH